MADIMGALSGALGSNGSPSLNESISSFNTSNLSTSDFLTSEGSIPSTLGGIPGIGSRIPGLGKYKIPGVDKLNNMSAKVAQFRFGKSGEWQSLSYADDMNAHAPKFKFLFKVGFYGFGDNRDFYYFVHKIDRPKVKFVHQDVNYYNFRTKVLTHVAFDPIMCTIVDEIGNSVTDFFEYYLASRSGQGQGNWGIDKGFGKASSSLPYKEGYSDTPNARVIVEQLFMNPTGGIMSNRYIFKNVRLESFDLDELTHEDSNTGSMANISFNYDAIETMTVIGSTIYSWGQKDIMKGGGTSGEENAHQLDGIDNPEGISSSAVIGGKKKSAADKAFEMLAKPADALANLPKTLGGLISGGGKATGSSGDTLSSGISSTLAALKSGFNSAFSGGSKAPSNPAPADISDFMG